MSQVTLDQIAKQSEADSERRWRENIEKLRQQRDALAARLAEADAEIARLRALMTEMSKHRSSHIIQHSVFPSPEEYEAYKARDIHLGPTVTYTCGIHNIGMSEHGDRCPECDRTADSVPPGETAP